jgi:hypothetical protein
MGAAFRNQPARPGQAAPAVLINGTREGSKEIWQGFGCPCRLHFSETHSGGPLEGRRQGPLVSVGMSLSRRACCGGWGGIVTCALVSSLPEAFGKGGKPSAETKPVSNRLAEVQSGTRPLPHCN